MFELIVLLILTSSVLFWSLLGYLEHRQLWTLRFKIALWTPYLVLIPTSLPLFLQYSIEKIEAADFVREVDASFMISLFNLKDTKKYASTIIDFINAQFENVSRALIGAAALTYLVFVIRYVLPLIESRKYLRLRWKAWSGPSRTGIAAPYSRLVGGEADWATLSRIGHAVPPHPVEKFSGFRFFSILKLEADPTDLLKSAANAISNGSRIFTPESQVKTGAYQPAPHDQSISLLWGEHLGFRRRCSRGIISVSRNLLTHQPAFDLGYDGRAICLAYGILARNKGPEPWKLVCNLNTQSLIKVFEENSIQWPRPAKTLRSIYRAEFARTFSLLGEAYIVAATELALLIADTGDHLIEDWLDSHMEHQDLDLNHRVAESGATDEDLARLYRGHYAAMLVSLSTHRKGVRIRPEILVYEALCQREGADHRPRWLLDPRIVDRRVRELTNLGAAGQLLISVVI